MEQLGLNEIREKYLAFFESKGHLRHPSFPLVPQGDASLLLINSGMAPLKPYFSGEVTPPGNRMTTCQKCIRLLDIENVGKTSRHGTFFEMLGNFSFGDYFKKEAAAWAWEFVTGVMEIPKDKLYVSVYLDDDEAWDIWTKEVGVEERRMTRLGKADNFWEIGAGPCGPCSEIYYDRGEAYGCGKPSCAIGCDCDRYVEFWNLVFTQYNNDGENNYTPLAQKNIDTGMGLERIACIMQGVNSIFDVDTIRNILIKVSELTETEYEVSEKADVSLRIITDHIRSSVMMVCDGVLPSNEGRGYILRRLIRRAARHGKLLGVAEPFLYKLCDTVIDESRLAYPELEEKRDYIKKVLRNEEESFNKTIDNGLGILKQLVGRLSAEGRSQISGDDSFKLYDTYGFPVDLTLEIAEENGITIDLDGFNELMRRQRERARAARSGMGDVGWVTIDLGLNRDIQTEFTGYNSFEEKAKVLAIVVEDELRSAAYEGEKVAVVLNKTPFYAEGGGQVADWGHLADGQCEVEISDVKKLPDGKYLHIGEVVKGKIIADQQISAAIDAERRKAVMRAHSATHLLQKALRDVLGTHVEQAGSLVEPDRVRFDFTHFSAVEADEVTNINRMVNDMILEGMEIHAEQMSLEQARKMGAMALFGEKYGDVVRVVSMGDKSIELCGGTHLENTAKIGPFRIMSEFSVASGVRRIEAIVGGVYLDHMENLTSLVRRVSETLKASPDELLRKAQQSIGEMKQLRQSLERMSSKALLADAERYLNGAINIGGFHVLTARLDGADSAALRQFGDFLRDKDDTIVAVMAAADGDKIVYHAVCGKKAVGSGLRAGDIIRTITKISGGNGGGKPDSAMGGGQDISLLDKSLSAVEGFVSEKVNQ